MHVVNQPLIPSTATSAANAIQAPTVVPADAIKGTICLGYLGVTFAGGVPAAALLVTVSDGTTTFTFVIAVAGQVYTLNNPIRFAKGATVTVTVPAAGVGITSKVDIGTFQDLIP
jgi:hypothetical protein